MADRLKKLKDVVGCGYWPDTDKDGCEVCVERETLKIVAKAHIRQLQRFIRDSAEQEYPKSIIDSYSAQIVWIKDFFDVGDD